MSTIVDRVFVILGILTPKVGRDLYTVYISRATMGYFQAYYNTR
jgi:hypothetical protein